MLPSTTGETKPLPPPANLNSRMVMALAQAARNQLIHDKTDMQATFNHLITSFGMLDQGVSDGSILRVLFDSANVLIVEIVLEHKYLNYSVNMLPAKVTCSAYSQVSTVKHIGLPFHKNRSVLLGRSLSRAGLDRSTRNGQTRNHRSRTLVL